MPIAQLRTMLESSAGYPLSYFAGTEPFATWLHKGRSVQIRSSNHTDPPPTDSSVPVAPADWMDHVHLATFTSRLIPAGPRSEGGYEYVMEFTTTLQIAIAIPRPQGMSILFGTPPKAGKPPDRLKLRLLLEPKYGRFQRLDISGDVRFRFPRGLIRPVVERNGRWVDASVSHIAASLGPSILRIDADGFPRVIGRIVLPNVTARIGRTDVVAKLKWVDVAGTVTSPKLRFKDIQIVYLTN
jgi:hypothetical protein